MTDTVQDWLRPHFVRSFGPALHFYVVFGPVSEPLKISVSRHRCDAIPEGIDIMKYGPGQHSEIVSSFGQGYPWAQLCSNDKALAELIASQDQCTVLRGETEDGPTLNDFRNVVGLVTSLLEAGGVAVYDPQRFKWWSAVEWQQQVFEPAEASPRTHVTILVSEDDGGTEWVHTRGMRKFGRPDLSVHGVLPEHRDAVIDLFERFIEYLAFGGVIEEGQAIRMRSLPPGMICRHAGSHGDEDFNNVHVEVHWPKQE